MEPEGVPADAGQIKPKSAKSYKVRTGACGEPTLLADPRRISAEATMSAARRRGGQRGEQIAADYLRRRGFRLIARNVHYRVGELDIVAEHGGVLVFVEVRSRSTKTGLAPEQTVTWPKQRRLTRAARLFLTRYGGSCAEARFDVIGVDLRQRRVAAHLIAAFDAVEG